MRLSTSEIRTDGGTQPRAELDEDTVAEYAADMERGDEFPPVKVVHDGTNHWLVDGFHRLEAAKQIGREEIKAKVEQGTKEEAQWASLAANKKHGLRRSQEDKRRAIKRALKGWGTTRSDRMIAEHIGCSPTTVGKYREELESLSELNSQEERTGADGRTINTSSIGEAPSESEGDGIPEKYTKDDRPTGRGDDRARQGEGLGGPSGEHYGNAEDEPASPDRQEKRKHNIDVIGSSESNEYYTPRKYIEAARKTMGGIDLDPASCKKANEVVRADKIFTKEEDGLAQKWRGRVWLNPPYGAGVDVSAGDFVEKLMEELDAGRVEEAVLLVNAHSTDTKWFQPLWDGLLCFTDHRIDFRNTEGKAGSTHGSVFVYFGEHEEPFTYQFDQFGHVVQEVIPHE